VVDGVEFTEELRDPSGYFVTYETGDNTVVTVDTGTVPLDMYYARAFNFGDDYDEQDICATDLEDPWYPSAGLCEEGETDLRWDWLENGPDLATEASVFGNPRGDRFYALWNQELEVAYEVYTDMDSEFRRIFYNFDTDTYPVASILYASVQRADYDDEDILLVGSGRDTDRLGGDPSGDGISNARWWVDDDTGQYWYNRTWQFPPSGFVPGRHDFHFQVQDNEGNWSVPQTVNIWIVEQFYDVYLPAVSR